MNSKSIERFCASSNLWAASSGDRISYEANEDHKQQVQAVIGELARRLREEDDWQPICGEQRDRYQYAQHCPALQSQPEPIAAAPRKLQLCLSL